MIGAFRFVHAADIHLDSPLRSLALRDSELAEMIGNATRRAFERIISICLDEQVVALILAGDLYDGDQTSMKTARFLAEQLKRLDEAGIRTFIVRGNHDAMSRVTKELILPDSVKTFSGRAEAIAFERDRGQLPVFVHGLSFAQPHAPESLLTRYRPAVEGAANIGILHTSLAGLTGHDPYAPCSVADLRGTGFSYWALGHIHKRSAFHGASTIVMPGMPQGRDINEAGPKSVTLVTVHDDRSVEIEERLTSVAEFSRVSVDATGIDAWADLVRAAEGALAQARTDARSEHLVARVQFVGATPLAWRARYDVDLLREELALRASDLGRCWIEKLDIDCRPIAASSALTGDPRAELRRLVSEEILKSDNFHADARQIAEELRNQLPPESRALLGTDETSLADALAELARQGADDVLARLEAPGQAGDA